jgi:hypothetical protein
MRVFGLALLWAMWLITALAFAWLLVTDALDYAGMPCQVPRDHSNYGTASWSWWPPGETCRDDGGRVFAAPSREREALMVAAISGVAILPVLMLGLVRAERKARGGADDTLSHLLTAESPD